MRRLLVALVATLGLAALATPASADPPAGWTYSDQGLVTTWLGISANPVTPGSDLAVAKVSVTVRAWRPCSTCAVERVDAAARAYDLGNPAIGNVQVEGVRLLAYGPPAALRAGPSGLSNSNGGGATALISTSEVCVGIGTGRYFAFVDFSMRDARTGAIRPYAAESNPTGAVYATVAC